MRFRKTNFGLIINVKWPLIPFSAWLFECDWEQNGNNLYIIKTAKY